MDIASLSQLRAGTSDSDKKNQFAQKPAIDFAKWLGEDESPAEILRKITSRGISSMWEWQMEELKKKVAAKVMQEMGVSPESLAAMSPEARMSIEEKIMKEVERRIEEAMRNGLEKKQGQPIDIGQMTLSTEAFQLMLTKA
jgi:hypothetical protein